MMASGHGIDRAVRIGGRLACVSLLALLEVFVLDASRLHVHLPRSMSRLRSPDDPSRRFAESDRRSVRLHWWPCRADPGSLATVGLIDAVLQAVRCQEPRAAVATLDSILYRGLMTKAELRSAFEWLPERYGVIFRLCDGIAESGPETMMRLILRQLNLRYVPQAYIAGVGRVDFLVEGWLIIECDSKAHHEGWAKQRQDRHRDLAAAAAGYTTLRPLAADLMFDCAAVAAAVRGLVRAHR